MEVYTSFADCLDSLEKYLLSRPYSSLRELKQQTARIDSKPKRIYFKSLRGKNIKVVITYLPMKFFRFPLSHSDIFSN